MAKDKRRNKKYRPKTVRPAPILLDVTLGAVTDEDRARMAKFASSALDVTQLGSRNPKHYNNLLEACRACFVLAAAYEQKSEIQCLAMLGAAGTHALWEDVEARAKAGDNTVDLVARAAAAAPIQRVIETLERMQAESPRSECVAAFRTASTFRMDMPIKDVRVVHDDGKPPKKDDPLIGERGIAYVHGEARPGYLKWDGKRLVWYMPQTDSQFHLKERTLVLLAPSAVNYLRDRA